MAAIVLIIAIAIVVIGYQVYAAKMDKEVIQANPKKATPATLYNDGVDFMPASGSVLFGYQFKSIAALGPIVGPIVAVQWGWLPTFLWLMLGVFFIGWVQDYASAMMAMRNDGLTMGGLAYKFISPRARGILLAFLYFYLLLIMGAFGAVVAGLLAIPVVPVGLFILTLAGVLAGQMTYRWKMDLVMTTIITVLIALIGIWLGTMPWAKNLVNSINSLAGTGPKHILYNTPYGPMTWPQFFWGIVALAFCYLGSVLAIWRFAQPVNYVSFWFVALGLLGSILGVFVAAIFKTTNVAFQIPAYVTWNQPKLGWLWPILFVTVSCGAISGWHSLVSTAGTARQLEKETDALPVGAGAMFTEAILATMALIFAATALTKGNTILYDAKHMYFLKVKAGAVWAYGMSRFLSWIPGISPSMGAAIGAIFLAVMALTVMQLVLRFMRVASAELVGDKIPAFKNPHVGTIVAILFTFLILWTAFWQRIWVLFGGANQLFAGLALLLITIWLANEGRKHGWVFWPMVFMYVTTVTALLVTAWKSFHHMMTANISAAFAFGDLVAGVIALFLALAAVILAYDGLKSLAKARAKAASHAGN